MNQNIEHNFFVWEEKNLIDQSQNLLKNAEQDKCVITTETKTNVENPHWRDITDPKLRNKMYKKEWALKNQDKCKARRRKWKENNKQKIKIQYENYKLIKNEKRRQRKKTDIQFKLNGLLRSRIHDALKCSHKAGSVIKDMGCSLDELKNYIESKFQPGMSWDNHGFYGWHIDHIKPLASFDLTDRKQFLEACHYTNLQPLWAKDNIVKKDKII